MKTIVTSSNLFGTHCIEFVEFFKLKFFKTKIIGKKNILLCSRCRDLQIKIYYAGV